MKNTATFRRTAVGLSLVAAVITSAIWTLTMPAFPADYSERLAAIDEAGASGTISAVFFCVSQLFWLGAVLGIAHLMRRGSPALSNIGGAVAVVGTLAHAVFGGANLITLGMAQDTANRELYAALIEDFESSPMVAFAMAGLLGTVLGLLLLSIGLFRSRVVPRWIPVLLWSFLVVEFVGTALSEYASYVSAIALAFAFGALARHVWQSPESDWAGPEAPAASTVATQQRRPTPSESLVE